MRYKSEPLLYVESFIEISKILSIKLFLIVCNQNFGVTVSIDDASQKKSWIYLEPMLLLSALTFTHFVK